MRHAILVGLFTQLVLLLLMGCTTTSAVIPDAVASQNPTPVVQFEQLPINKALLNEEVLDKPPSVRDIFQLTEQQEQEFLHYYFDENRSDLAPDRRLASFIERRYADFHYYGTTLKASESLQGQAGNCMSLATLTTAYARLVGLEVRYQLVYSVPIYELLEDTLYVSSHVRTQVVSPPNRNPETGVVQFSNSTIDYFPGSLRSRGSWIAESLFISMFYQNVAAEYLKQGDEQNAFLYAMEALRIAPENAAAINIMAVLHRRKQDEHTAEKLYRHILEYNPVNLNAMINYREMLRSQGRLADAAALHEAIARIDDPNPYEWIYLADEAIRQNSLVRAERYLQRAQHYAPYLDEIYYRQAQIDYLRGHFASAQRRLLTAHHYARSSDRRGLYKAKLGSLHASD
ncbi:transglutaminase domain-containing protein [Alkalimonas delamerensis]|uniref:Transglutaminase domain-containing protein n=1 Tax=Alkalimonas delamerensis TaxID=265981 RepID=A0ABT9GQY7_9GAMM|nr:transglutaminase domain-containing protein [Alkalimonas delamerensis]MDP4529366.1 transglutaminase domain-containing protein [Alkalimonas delamerensis]